MALIHLQGQVTCRTPQERRDVLALLPMHLRQSLRDPGCLFFDLKQADDPMHWQIDAGFASRAAHADYEARTAKSTWGQVTLRLHQSAEIREVQPQITPETPADQRALYLLNRAAFGGTGEAELVDALRASGDLALSLVARFGRAYLGHIAFSPIAAPFPAWALAPVAVRDAVRQQGLAAALVRAGLAQARARGIEAVFVLGDPAYYGRFGFSVGAAQGYECPYAGPYFQMLALNDAALPKGALRYAAPFDALED
ncbi:putative N-acetyltransferase YhbS [Rhodobacter aestuarii]|uniref:Predicted N-acetyltransferase YhbS n=1 Tax=Rhodobacter aestuarii TaxID=453582 RepID=A0A1N7JD47_9RHOB|nr:N-acetyltransferase [Rhodobacter aestuarii]PTV96913.1 putative N-acetyltransferase YhbS [Rhodobacter aestuarii]SIS47249.1 Predicted N-acetyltransferase YhbS [Rhodobacter aestuarii]